MCGIWGIINTEVAPFDYKTFCVLGIANDKRGGDSCGIFIDGKYEYGIKETALFENFYPGSKLLHSTKRCHIAIGHDRKASSGGISLEKAQPVIIEEDGKVKFVLIHNGTIHNYEELAKEHIPGVDIKGMSDTQVLARLLYYYGYNILGKYMGSAALVTIDYRGDYPKIIMFRGESKKYSTYGNPEEERPLYLNYKNGRLVFSSVSNYIRLLDGGHCYYLPENAVIEYKNGRLLKHKDIDRSKCSQNKPYSYSGYGAYGGYGGYGGYDDDGEINYTYMRHFSWENTFGKDANPLTGKIRVSPYGRIAGSKETSDSLTPLYTIYFFHGIPMLSEKAYDFANRMFTKVPLVWGPFYDKYKNFLRFLSIDNFYNEGNIWRRAIGPLESEIFTGEHQVLFQTAVDIYKDGKYEKRSITTGAPSNCLLPLNKDSEIDYEALWKIFEQSTV